MNWPRLYARGFFLSPDAVDLLEKVEHYQRHELSGAILYADTISDIGVARRDDDWLVSVGKMLPLSTGVIQSRGNDIATELFEILQRHGIDGIQEALYDVGGRYAVLMKSGGETYAYNDAAGHRTVYFNHGQQRIASHFDMLHQLTPVQNLTCPVGSTNMSAHPEGLWDLTENPHIKALLPNHRLDLRQGTQARFGLKEKNPYTHLRWEDRISLISDLWQEQLARVFDWYQTAPVGLSLSGGLDSRTMLAHLRPYVDRIKGFTYTAATTQSGEKPRSFWERTVTTDHDVLLQMRDHLPEDFHVILRPERSNLTEEENSILARNTMRSHGRYFIKPYHELFSDIQSIHLRGNMVEMGRLIRGRPNISGQRNRLAPIIRAVARRRSPDLESYTALFWRKVDEFEYDLLHEDVEYTDAYHWENRSSRWYAEVANETDTVFDSIVPVNVRRIYDLLVSQPIEVRPGAQLQYDLIHHAWPELLAYGINTETDLYSATLRNELRENLS